MVPGRPERHTGGLEHKGAAWREEISAGVVIIMQREGTEQGQTETSMEEKQG